MSTATVEVTEFVVKGSVEVRTDVQVDLAALIRKHPNEYASVKLDGYQRWERPVVFLEEYLRDQAYGPGFGVDVRAGFDEVEIDLRPWWSRDRYRELCAVCPEADVDRIVEATFGRHRADRDADAIGPLMRCLDCGKVWRLPLSPMERDDLADDECPGLSL